MTRPFIDTNVALYAYGVDGPKRDTARAVLAKGGRISVQVLNEFAHVARNKLKRTWPDIRAALDVLRDSCGPVMALTEEMSRHALVIAEREKIAVYDALIVAAAAQAGCTVLLTEDLQSGRTLQGVRIVDPFHAPLP